MASTEYDESSMAETMSSYRGKSNKWMRGMETSRSSASVTSLSELNFDQILMRPSKHIPLNDTLETPRRRNTTPIRPNFEIKKPQRPIVKKPRLVKLMDEFISKDKGCCSYLSLRVCVHSQAFECNKPMLICYSRYFRNRRFRSKVTLRGDLKASTFKAVYQWMLTDRAIVHGKEVLAMLKAAEYLGIDDLIEQCWTMLSDAKHIKNDVAFMLCLEAQRLLMPEVMKVMLQRIDKFFLIVVATREFLEMDVDDVILLLSSDSLGVNTEIEVFMACVRWLDYNWIQRCEHAVKLLSCVRFKLMPGWFLVLLNANRFGNNILQNILKHSSLRSVIEDALSCVTSYLYLNRQEVLAAQNQRTWIYDKHCNYHTFDQQRGVNRNQITFESFTKYLNKLSLSKKPCWQEFLLLKEKDPLQSRQLFQKVWSHSENVPQFMEKPPSVLKKSKTFLDFASRRDPSKYRNIKANSRKERTTQEINEILNSPLLPLTRNERTVKKCSSTVPFVDPKFTFNPCKVKSSKECLNHSEKETKTLRISFHGNLYIVGGSDPFDRRQFDRELNPILNEDGTLCESKHYGDEVLRFNADRNTWEEDAFMPFGPRIHHASVLCGNLIYIIGGTRKTNDGSTQKTIFEKTIWSFNPETKQWNLVSILPELRRNHAAVSVDCGFYIIGGEDANGSPLDSVWFYNLNNLKWRKVQSLNEARYGLTAARHKNKLWVAGGIALRTVHQCLPRQFVGTSLNNLHQCFNHEDNEISHRHVRQRFVTDSVEYFDLDLEEQAHSIDKLGEKSTVTWRLLKENLSSPRAYAKLCATSDEKLFLIGGVTYNDAGILTSSNSVEYFNSKEKVWERHGHLKVPRHGHDSVGISENILIVGGTSTEENRAFESNEIYCTNPQRNKTTIANLPWPLSGCSVIYVP